MRLALLTLAALVPLAACQPPAANTAINGTSAANTVVANAAATSLPPAAANIPGGDYRLDKLHASLVFRVSHIGFSNYTGRFEDWDARLRIDPAQPEAAQLEVTINPRSLEADQDPPGFLDMLRGPDWLDAARGPITYRSTQITRTGPNTARIRGDFTMRGVTRPVVVEATFNGGYPGMASLDPHARIGFSGRGSLRRSEFGLTTGIPAPGTTMGVGDQVDFVIESEFTGPPLAEGVQGATPPPEAAN